MKMKKKERELIEKVKTKIFETLVSLATTELFKLIVKIIRLLLSI